MDNEKVVPIDWESVEGADWVQNDPKAAAENAGYWVVARGKEIVARGMDSDEVRRDAAELLSVNPMSLMVCWVSHPDQWMTDAYVSPDDNS